MKRIEAGSVMLVAALIVGCSGGGDEGGSIGGGEPTIAPPTPSATTLFDGSSLDGWNMTGDANWHILEDYVEANSGSGHLVSAESYGDFRLTAEFWVDEDANSGIFIRCSDPADIGSDKCYEVNIFDKRPEQNYRTGAIVDLAEPMAQIDAGGQWNTYEIVAQGSHLMVTLNGQKTVDVMDTKHASGPFTLQYGAGIVRFRNVQITPL
jgi:hypothetical protein